MNALERLGHRAVRQRQIEQHKLDAALGQARETGGQKRRVFDAERGAGFVAEVFADEPGVARVVLDEQDLELANGRSWFHDDGPVCLCGPRMSNSELAAGNVEAWNR